MEYMNTYPMNFKMLPEHDQRLIEEAQCQRWEEIDEDAAETEEARQVLHDIAIRKYHRDEYCQGII